MELEVRKRERKKSSRRDVKLSKAATLPPGAVLMDQPGEGFFSKIRRSFKIHKKNKYRFSYRENLPEASIASPTILSTSTGSLKSSDSVITKSQSKPQKTSQEISRAKEEAVLSCSKSGSCSLETHFDHTASLEESVLDESKKAGIEQDCCVSHGKKEAAARSSGVFTVPTDENSDMFFEGFDPDYETLDDIRRKLRTGDKGDQSSSTINDAINPAVTKSGLQENNGHDRNGHSGSLAISSDVDNVQENHAEPIVGADLYANAKVLMRKQSQKKSKSQEIPLVPEHFSDGVVNNETRSVSHDCRSAEFVGMEQAESSQSVLPPPLPARNYLEKDMNAVQNKSDSFEDSNTGLNQSLESFPPPPLPARNYSEKDVASLLDKSEFFKDNARLNQNHVSVGSEVIAPVSNEQLCFNCVRYSENTRISPETVVDFRKCAVIEQGPVLTFQSGQRSFQGSNCDLSDVHSDLPCSPFDQTLFISTHSGHKTQTTSNSACSENLMLRQNTHEKKDFKQIEDELLFIDEDPLDVHGYQPERTEKMECDGNTIVSSDSCNDSVCRSGSAAHNSVVSEDNKKTAGKVECTVDVAANIISHNTCGSDNVAHSLQASVDNSATTEKTEYAEDDAASSTLHEVHINGNVTHGSLENMQDISKKTLPFQHLPSVSVVNSDTLKESPREKSKKTKDKNSEKCQEKRNLKSQNSECSALEKNSEHPSCTVGEIDSSVQPNSSSESTFRLSSCVATLAKCSPSSLSSRTPSYSEDNQMKTKNGERKGRRSVARTQSLDLSQHFLRFPDASGMIGVDPPPLPARPVPIAGAAGRKAVLSEELPLRRAKDHSQTSQSQHSKNRRHFSDVAAAIAHKDFLKSMKQLKECGWYWGPLKCDEAEVKLMDKCDGSFLVRDSSNDKYLLAISFKYRGHVHHTRIEYHKGLFSFWEQPDEHSKAHICQFIEQTVENSRKGHFIYFQSPSGAIANPLPIQLLYPVSRFCRLQSLQHSCRFLILRLVRRDLVDELPLPEKVKRYLLEEQYYVEHVAED